jgi:hypothetical protein
VYLAQDVFGGGFSNHANGNVCSVNDGVILESLSEYRILKKKSAPEYVHYFGA